MYDKIFCYECNREAGTYVIDKEETYTVKKDTDITMIVKVRICDKCGAEISDIELDDDTMHKVYAEYKRIHNLMQSEDVKALREKLNLSQLQLADLIGCSEKQIVRIERGCLQTKEQDILLRKVLN